MPHINLSPTEYYFQNGIEQAGATITGQQFFETTFTVGGNQEYTLSYDDMPHLYRIVDGKNELMIAGEYISPEDFVEHVKQTE